MNELILEKARELGQLIKESDPFIAMHLAEEKANTNQHLLGMTAEYEQLRAHMQELTVADNPNYDLISSISKQMDALHDKMTQEKDMRMLQMTRKEFSALMNMVNRELQGVLAPETLQEEAQGCSGSCSGCSGCPSAF